MVSSTSWQLAVHASLVLFAGLTTAKPVLHWPTLLDRQDAGATTSADVAGSATTTASSATQSNSDIGVQVAENLLDLIDVDGWCENLDTSDPDELIRIWEDKGVAIMMDAYTNGQGDGWLKRLADHTLPRSGDAGYDGCGVIGGSCDMSLDCDTMAARFMGMEYWILKAVEGYHEKLQVAHEFLLGSILDNFLSLGAIAEDFSAPGTSNGMSELVTIASLLSAGIFLGGGVAGAASAVATSTQRAAAVAKVNAEKASRQALVRQNIPEVNRQDALEEAARIVEKRNGGISRQSNALGSGLWLTASSFTAVGAFADAEGSVEAEDLEPVLLEMFSSARDQMVSQASIVMGRGGDYSLLTGADGNGAGPTLDEESYIARHFSDGKFLLSESSPVFNESIRDSYGTFKSKIVDQALQTGGFQVLALTDKEEKDCDMYGAQWMQPLNDGEMYCLQLHRDNFGNGCDTADTCDWVPATKAELDMLQNKYGFDITAYYSAAVECSKSGLENRIPDFVTMLSDQVTPACYYSINARKAKKEQTCVLKGLSCSSKMTLSDF